MYSLTWEKVQVWCTMYAAVSGIRCRGQHPESAIRHALQVDACIHLLHSCLSEQRPTQGYRPVSFPIRSLTHSLPPHSLLCSPPAPQALSEEADGAAAEVARLETADIGSMWAQDLDEFMEVRAVCVVCGQRGVSH
jgi:hypothetical protein